MALPTPFLEVTIIGAIAPSMLNIEFIVQIVAVATDVDHPDRANVTLADGTELQLIDTYDNLSNVLQPSPATPAA